MLKEHLLIVDDDERIRKLLKKFLTKSGYKISTAENSSVARQLNQQIKFDMLIIDIMMPGEDGLSLTKFLSKIDRAPILLLSAKVEASERILGFEMGADDYLTKPFEPRELLLRVEAILKRSSQKSNLELSKEIFLGDFSYNVIRQELWFGKNRINLTSVETKLMQAFSRRPNCILDRDELLQHVSESVLVSSTNKNNLRNIDVQIKRLRQKIEKDPKNPGYLKTIRGYGYVLEPD